MDQCGFLTTGHAVEEDRQPMRARHTLDSCVLDRPLVLQSMPECPDLAPERSPGFLASDHAPVVLSIGVAVAAKERITGLAYLYAQGRLHAIRPDSPGVDELAATVLQRACDYPAL